MRETGYICCRPGKRTGWLGNGSVYVVCITYVLKKIFFFLNNLFAMVRTLGDPNGPGLLAFTALDSRSFLAKVTGYYCHDDAVLCKTPS